MDPWSSLIILVSGGSQQLSELSVWEAAVSQQPFAVWYSVVQGCFVVEDFAAVAKLIFSYPMAFLGTRCSNAFAAVFARKKLRIASIVGIPAKLVTTRNTRTLISTNRPNLTTLNGWIWTTIMI